MKKLLSILLTLCLILGIFSGITVSAAVTETSAVGEEIEYSFADGVLTLTGSGEMGDYFFESTPWYKYADETKKVVISDGITTIGGCAFYDFIVLEEIEIPNTVTSIGINAFTNCGLSELYIPKSVEKIDEMPFVNCDRMKKYTVDPENPYFCSSEDGVLFSKDMSALIAYPLARGEISYTVPDEVVEIKGYAFSREPMLEKVTFGRKVKSIGDECFFNCPNLTTVEFSDVLEYIGGGAFQHCHGITEFKLPSTISKIRPLAFWDTGFYNNLENWENNLLYIGEYLITGEYYLDNEDYTQIEEYYATGDIVIKEGTVLVASDAFSWFSYDPEIYSVSFPSTMRYINEFAFYGLNNITRVELNGCMEWIDDYAFYSCKNLANIILGDNIKKIGVDAFAKTAYVSNENHYVDGLLYNGQYLLGYTGSLSSEIEIREGTTLIAAGALSSGGTYYSHSVKLPESLEIICKEAFLGTNTGEIEIPATVTYIGDYAIGYRKITTSYTEEYVLMDGSAIKGDPKTEAEKYAQDFLLEFKSTVQVKEIVFGCFTGHIIDGEILIVDFTWDPSYSGEVDIPAAEYGYTITGIESGAFHDCSGLTSISMFEYVTYIGEDAFVNCDNVTFYFPCGSTAHTYAESNGLNYVAECIFPQDNDIDGIENVCPGCERTQCEVQGHIMNGVPGTYYVYECIRDGCEYIEGPDDNENPSTGEEEYTEYFENGYSYTVSAENEATITGADNSIIGYVQIPEFLGGYKVTAIAQCAFTTREDITGVVIPDSVVSIGNYAFDICTSLFMVEMGNGVTTIGENAFDSCQNLTEVYYSGTEEQWNNITIENGNSCLTNAAIHFSNTSDTTEPITDPAEPTTPSESESTTATEPSEPTTPSESESTTATEPSETTAPTTTAKTTVKLAKSSATVYLTGTTTIKATVTNGKGKTAYKSSNTKVATVNSNGKVTAKKAGKATITVTNNGVSKKFTVTVKNPKLNKTKATLTKGKSLKLKITGKVGTAKFTSGNKKIATVSKTGKIVAKKKGTVTIKVKTNGITLKCKVKVK